MTKDHKPSTTNLLNDKISANRLLKTIAATSAMVFSVQAMASPLGDYYNFIGNANVNKGGAYSYPNSTSIIAPSVYYRSPQLNTSPLSFTPPGISAGCGGISFYGGALSVYKDAFRNFFTNVANALPGVLVTVAMKAVSPQIGGVIANVADKLAELSRLTSNTCQAMMAASDNLYNSMTSHKAASLDASSGASPDMTSAQQTNGDPTVANKTVMDSLKKLFASLPANPDNDYLTKAVTEPSINFLMLALDSSHDPAATVTIPGSTGGYWLGDDQRLLLQSILGTVIKSPTVTGDLNSPPKTPDVKYGILTMNHALQFLALSSSTSLGATASTPDNLFKEIQSEIQSCDQQNYTYNNCLNLKTGGTLNGPAMEEYIYETFDQMQGYMDGRTKPDATAITKYNSIIDLASTLPIRQAMSIVGITMLDDTVKNNVKSAYAQAAAYFIVAEYLHSYLLHVAARINNIAGLLPDEQGEYKKALLQYATNALDKANEAYDLRDKRTKDMLIATQAYQAIEQTREQYKSLAAISMVNDQTLRSNNK